MVKKVKFYDLRKLLNAWKASWEVSNQKNPYSAGINRDLMKKGYGIHDVKNAIGLVLAKKKELRTDEEEELLEFDSMARLVAESALVDQCGETTNGAIFLLESKYGYRKGSDISISMEKDVVKKVVRWGDEEGTDSAEVAPEAVANG